MKIAVFIGDNGMTLPFNQCGITRVYKKEKDAWEIEKEISFEISDSISMNEIRNNVKNMAESLEQCGVFAAKEVNGIYYTILDGMGFSIWKVEGRPEDFLDVILEDEEEEKLKKIEYEVIPSPVKNGSEGNYFIDLKTEIQNNEKYTSKQILLPFFNTVKFNELEVICSHVPPWFQGEFERLNFRSLVEKINENTFKVKVYPENIA